MKIVKDEAVVLWIDIYTFTGIVRIWNKVSFIKGYRRSILMCSIWGNQIIEDIYD